MVFIMTSESRVIEKSKDKIDELKKYLEERISQLKKELEYLELLLSFIESGVLSKKVLSREMRVPKPGEEVLPLKTTSGEHIADIYIGKNEMRVIPLVDLDVNTPPFRAFLINRILERLKRKDKEAVEKGLILPDQAFDYEIDEENGVIREIRLINVSDERRKIELKSAIKWTLEKMYERVKRKSR